MNEKVTHYAYMVYDKRLQRYLEPLVLFPSDSVAIRSFVSSCIGDSMLHQFPDDYVFRRLAEFNENDGAILACPIVDVITAVEAINMKSDKESKDE